MTNSRKHRDANALRLKQWDDLEQLKQEREENMRTMTRCMHEDLLARLEALGIDFFELRQALKTADEENTRT